MGEGWVRGRRWDGRGGSYAAHLDSTRRRCRRAWTPRGGPLGGEGLDPSPRALEARTTHKSTSRRCSRIWDPFGSQIDARRIEHLLVERRSKVLALPSIPHAAGDHGRWEPAHRARRYRATRSDKPATPIYPRTHYSPSAGQLQLHAQAAQRCSAASKVPGGRFKCRDLLFLCQSVRLTTDCLRNHKY